jgi:hypothetical protein
MSRTAQIISFPPRGPFVVRILRDGVAWLVVCRDHGWLHGGLDHAIDDADEIAEGFAVEVKKVNGREKP